MVEMMSQQVSGGGCVGYQKRNHYKIKQKLASSQWRLKLITLNLLGDEETFAIMYCVENQISLINFEMTSLYFCKGNVFYFACIFAFIFEFSRFSGYSKKPVENHPGWVCQVHA